jgi:FkbM family methyltransferase
MNKDALKDLQLQGYRPRTLLDVGAHIGSFTREFLEFFPECTPTLIEPNPFCGPQLAMLGYEQYGVAASNAPGRAELFLTKEWLQSTGVSLYRENTAHFRDEVIVKHAVDTARIDDLFHGRRFDFVKIDTQGAELDVLRGGETVLRQADYILVEVSLVEYNAGGARAEAVFAQLTSMGFRCADVTEFHRLAGVQDGNLLQMDFLFGRRVEHPALTITYGAEALRLESLRGLARSLEQEGRVRDALLLLEHLDSLQPGNAETLQLLARTLGTDGQPLRAMEKLSALKAVASDAESLAGEIRAQMPAAIESFNEHIAAGEIEDAEKYAAALAALVPGNPELLNSALSCNVALGRKAQAARYAAALLSLDPAGAAALAALAGNARATVDAQAAIDRRVVLALSDVNDIHPLLRLRNLHDAIGEVLCRPLSARSIAQISALLAAAHSVDVSVPEGSEWEGWVKHYRVAIDAIDLPAILASTPLPPRDSDICFATSQGAALDGARVQKIAKSISAQTVFFAAADANYVELYGSHYIRSILEHCDVSCLIILHVIGGAENLRDLAQSVGIESDRLIFAGDRFDAGRVTTKCYDTPPRGLISRPVAHFQSMRFIRLGVLLEQLKLPVFVSDIDLLLQRGVEDLLQRCADADVVLNENTQNTSAGSRFTANLLLVNPTDNAALFLRFLQSYLEKALSGPEVSRWIDQFALILARHHLALHGTSPRIEYFDTDTDINNIMYRSYQANPYRFLSLYHGFDMSTLDKPGAQQAALAS